MLQLKETSSQTISYTMTDKMALIISNLLVTNLGKVKVVFSSNNKKMNQQKQQQNCQPHQLSVRLANMDFLPPLTYVKNYISS